MLPFHWERNLDVVRAVFGVMLRERRLAAGLTQEQLGFEASIRRNYVSMLELGQHQPTLTMLFSLATALKCAPSDLLSDLEARLAKSSERRKARPTRQRATAPRREAAPKKTATGQTR